MTQKQAEKMAKILGLPYKKLVNIGEGMFTFNIPILVTVKMAMLWLGKFNTDNRTPKSRGIGKMQGDITDGYWHVTHQGAAFMKELSEDNEPVLGDGQNRLLAICQARKSAKIRIFLGLERIGMLAVDTHIKRTPLDSLKFQGVTDVRNKEISALKFFLSGLKAHSEISSEAIMHLLTKWNDELEFIFDRIPHRAKRITAGVRGAIMRCYSANKNDPKVVEKIEKFCHILITGLDCDSKQVSKLKTNLESKYYNYGASGRKQVYTNTQSVLNHYLMDPRPTRIPKYTEELWPLDGENEGEKI